MQVLFLIFLSRVFFIISSLLSPYFVPTRTGYLGESIWSNFDGRHYLNIATIGYHRYDFAFFPLYPFIIKIVGVLIPFSLTKVGILVSFISLIGALVFVYKIVRIDFNERISKLTIIFLLFFPVSFYYHSVYPDSLFLLLSTACFYYARKERWILSGIFGSLTTLTRFSGISLVPALILEWYQQNRNKKIRKVRFYPILINLLLVGFGTFAYMVYLKVFFGDPFIFQKSMVAWHQNELVFPPRVIYRYIKIFLTVNSNLIIYWIAILEFVSFFFYLGLGYFTLRKIRASYGVFMIILLVLVSLTGTIAGTPRYILHLFPGFMAIAVLTYKKKLLRYLIFLSFLFLGFLLTSLFTRGYFVS